MKRQIYPISPNKAQVLAHEIRWKIMKLLSGEKSLYAKSIAELLGISEQKVHYHLTQLRDAGLLVPVGVRSIKRGRAKLFKPVANQFMLSLLNHDIDNSETVFNKIFQNNFCQQGKFNGKIVVGSAQPHGRYDAISRDGFLSGELCWYLGNYLPMQKGLVPHHVITDLEIEKSKGYRRTNLILIGGPITNTLTAHYNPILKSKFNIYFIENRIVCGSENFSNPAHGLISLFKHPNSSNCWILILAGIRSLGTKAAIYAIISDSYDTIGEGDEFATILHGDSQDGTRINRVTKVKCKSLFFM
ncbi:MAG: DUF2250 domain-containing protein [Candidatus Heimdallarchaeota archaeon]|nr:MAG: DUF2250 domain-containing protein [Candidatus Heimdallarchaeota archaeon]